LKIEFDPAAAREVDRAYRWYFQRSVPAAHRFLDELDTALEQIVAHPGLWPEHLYGTRFRNLERYPYFVVYLEIGEEIKIVAIQHAARRPGYWIKRLK
jgi:plasmid stabilization system protein ParE